MDHDLQSFCLILADLLDAYKRISVSKTRDNIHDSSTIYQESRSEHIPCNNMKSTLFPTLLCMAFIFKDARSMSSCYRVHFSSAVPVLGPVASDSLEECVDGCRADGDCQAVNYYEEDSR